MLLVFFHYVSLPEILEGSISSFHWSYSTNEKPHEAFSFEMLQTSK